MITRRSFLKGLVAMAVTVGFSPLKPFVIQELLKYYAIIHPDIQDELFKDFRGRRNPLFTGQLGVYNGVTFHIRKD